MSIATVMLRLGGDPSSIGLSAAVGERCVDTTSDIVWVKAGTGDTAWIPGTLAYGGGGGGGMTDPGSNGVVVRTALNTTVARTLVAGDATIVVTSGDGVAGNPSFVVGSIAEGQVLGLGADLAAKASVGDAFVTIGHPGDLTAERNLAAGTELTLTDGGANGDVTLALANGAAFTVLGRSANSSGIRADIQASASGHIFQRIGASLQSTPPMVFRNPTASYTVPANYSHVLAGPLTLADGIDVTVADGGELMVL